MTEEETNPGISRTRPSIPSNFEINNKSGTSTTLPSSVFNKEYTRTKFALYLELTERTMQVEAHLKRLQNLRKELTYIKNTDWQFEPPFNQS